VLEMVTARVIARAGGSVAAHCVHRSGVALTLTHMQAHVAAANGGVSKAAFVRAALRELAVAMCRGNALLYRVSMFQVARTTRRGYWPGVLVPTADVDHD
jgi:hypothetical protein